MYVIYMALWIASAAAFFLVAIRSWLTTPAGNPRQVDLMALGALLFVLVWLIQLARS